MIVEDEEDILNLYSDFLIKRGYLVSGSEDTKNVVANFEKYQPDICLIDHMVEGEGIGIYAAAQIFKKSPSTPILLVTAYESLTDELARHHEFDDKNVQVLIKPARLPELEDRIRNMVK